MSSLLSLLHLWNYFCIKPDWLRVGESANGSFALRYFYKIPLGVREESFKGTAEVSWGEDLYNQNGRGLGQFFICWAAGICFSTGGDSSLGCIGTKQ